MNCQILNVNAHLLYNFLFYDISKISSKANKYLKWLILVIIEIVIYFTVKVYGSHLLHILRIFSIRNIICLNEYYVELSNILPNT